MTEAQSWANEPIRRIHHSASSTGGKIWIVGGEKDDGSNNGLSDHYVFDPHAPSFTLLPSTNGPPDLYGHASVVLPNGQMLIFGGYCSSMGMLIPFSTIWAIDTTQSSLTFTSLSISNSSLPSPRRAFAVVLLDDSKILIQGGADFALQNVYSDGWILDASQDPMVWTSVEVLAELGPRYDHFAVATGSQVVFGWGYGPSGPADTTLQLYDLSSNSFVSSFTPAPLSSTATLPIPSQTQPDTGPSDTTYYGGTSTGSTGSMTRSAGSGTGSTMTGSVYPTHTQHEPKQSPNPSSSPNSKYKATTAIAVGTIFGVLALVVGVLSTGYYVRNHRQYPTGDRFHLLGGEGSEDGDGAHTASAIPTAFLQEKPRSRPNGWFTGNKKGAINQTDMGPVLRDTGPHRRDMFVDEDTREFGELAYGLSREDSGSSWSLHSMGAAMSSIGVGVRGIWSGQNNDDTDSSDPFLYSNTAVVRPHGHRQSSYASTLRSYHDPFEDHPIEEAAGFEKVDADESTRLTSVNDVSSRTTAPSTFGLHTLAPLTEQSSRTSDPTSSSSSQARPSSPLDSLPNSSFASFEYKPQRRSSIINSAPVPHVPIRRSDSWWTRFGRTSLRDRKSFDRSSKPLEIRDPHPAPRLIPIKEASNHSNSPSSPESQEQQNIFGPEHRKSVSSLRTMMTADSDAIERMGGMDVVQQGGSHGSHQTNRSSGHDNSDHDAFRAINRPSSIIAPSGFSGGSQSQTDDERTVASPVDMIASDISQRDSASDTSMLSAKGSSASYRPIPSRNDVLGRVHAYERRLSENAEAVSSPGSPVSSHTRNTRKREEVPFKTRITVKYGLAPRPSLYVANPDHTTSPSSDS